MRFGAVALIVFGVSLLLLVLSGTIDFERGGYLFLGGGLAFICGGLLVSTVPTEDIQIDWDEENKRLVAASNSGAIASFPFSSLSEIESFEYTPMHQNQTEDHSNHKTLIRYGVKVHKKDGGTIVVATDFEDEASAKAEVERLKSLASITDSIADAPNPIPNLDHFFFSPAVEVQSSEETHQWRWSTDRGPLFLMGVVGFFPALSTMIFGMSRMGNMPRELSYGIFVLALPFALIIKSLLNSRGRGERITIRPRTLLFEQVRNDEVIDVQELDLSKITTVALYGRELTFLEEPLTLLKRHKSLDMPILMSASQKDLRDIKPLLKINLYKLLTIDQFCLETHISAVIAQKTGANPDTI